MAEKRVKTLKCIAEQLGVSITTVSRVLNGRSRQYRISKKTEAAVLEIARQANFLPNQVARSLRLKKTLTLGLVIPDISNPFFASIARNVALEADKRGYSLILCDSQENTDREIEALALLQSRQVEGLILSPVGQRCEHLQQFENGSLPVVLVDRYFPELKLPFVASDNYGGAFAAVNYLLDRGHRKIACLRGLSGTSPNEERVRGYKDALSKRGVALNEDLLAGDSFGDRNGYIETKLLLQKVEGITAIFALSNLISLGSLQALAEEGLKVPDDISMICFDDQPYSGFLATPLTTVDQKNSDMGQIAVQMLFTRIAEENRGLQEGIILPTEFIERASVKDITGSNKDPEPTESMSDRHQGTG